MAKKIKVRFLKQRDGGRVFAFFPYMTFNTVGDRTSYAHMGQHSACSGAYAKLCKKAKPDEYCELLAELIAIGYNNLEVMDGIPTISKILEKVDTHRGAPMGRANVGVKPSSVRLYDHTVALRVGYDIGGAYWGWGKELRVEYTKDLAYIRFYRKGE